MPGPGWPFRLAIAVLFVVIVLVAVGLGWAKPGLFFYAATSIIGVLVWLDYEYSRRQKPRPGDHEVIPEVIDPTAPDVRKVGEDQ
jgi:hypothetical protein